MFESVNLYLNIHNHSENPIYKIEMIITILYTVKKNVIIHFETWWNNNYDRHAEVRPLGLNFEIN